MEGSRDDVHIHVSRPGRRMIGFCVYSKAPLNSVEGAALRLSFGAKVEDRERRTATSATCLITWLRLYSVCNARVTVHSIHWYCDVAEQ